MSETVGYLVVLCSSCGHAEHYGFCGAGADTTPGPCKCAHYNEPLKPFITFTYCPSCAALRASEAALAEKVKNANDAMESMVSEAVREEERQWSAKVARLEARLREIAARDKSGWYGDIARAAFADEEGKK